MIAVVIPCYRVRDRVLAVLAAIGPEVGAVFVVDDACPEKTGDHVEATSADPRVRVVRNATNLGVGGAVKAGYQAALAAGATVVVKIDGDGQMDPALVPMLAGPILEQRADYVKGNRFHDLDDLAAMPALRLAGNAFLSLVNKVSTGYWDVMDPTNGFTAVHARVLERIPLAKVADDYFFESDMLFRLATLRAVVVDLPMVPVYGDEPSSLRIGQIAMRFPLRYLARTFKRVFYGYFLRDFNAGSLQLVLGFLLAAGGTAFGLWHWYLSVTTGVPATSGQVMLAALPILFGGHLLLSAVNYDIANVPRRCIHPLFYAKMKAENRGSSPP